MENLENEYIKMSGQVKIEKRNLVGELVERVDIPNQIMAGGKKVIAGLLAQVASGTVAIPGVPSHMCVGIGSTVASDTDNKLPSTALTVHLGTKQPDGVTYAGGTEWVNTDLTKVKYTATFEPHTGSDYALTQAAIFVNDPTKTPQDAGTYMVCFTSFGTVTKTPNDTITITWTITIG